MTFEVDERTLYHLSGDAAAVYFMGGGDAEVILREEGGAVLFETAGFYCDFDPLLCQPISFRVTDVLAPGTYTVSALAYGSGSSPVDGEGWGSYSFTLELVPPSAQLPALGAAWRLLLAALLPLLGVKVVRRRSSGRSAEP